MKSGNYFGNRFGRVRGADNMQRRNCEATLLRAGPLAALLILISVAVACGGGQQAEPMPSPTTGPSLSLSFECAVTEVLPLETPVLLAGGKDPLPSGFDAVNSAECTFSEPVAEVTFELLRDGDVIHSQRVAVEPPDGKVGFPLSSLHIG